MASEQKKHSAACRCGKVALELSGAPIITVICYCESCQKAGAGFAALPGAPRALGADGGTGFVLQRKDRAVFARGAELLREHWRAAATRRCSSNSLAATGSRSTATGSAPMRRPWSCGR